MPIRIDLSRPGLTLLRRSIDPQRGTVEVRLPVNPVPDFLRQDMTVSVNVETADERGLWLFRMML